MGCRQAVRHQTLTLAFVGSNPAIPAKQRDKTIRSCPFASLLCHDAGPLKCGAFDRFSPRHSSIRTRLTRKPGSKIRPSQPSKGIRPLGLIPSLRCYVTMQDRSNAEHLIGFRDHPFTHRFPNAADQKPPTKKRRVNFL